jgi:hypothetical protein
MRGPAKPCVRVGERVIPRGEAQVIGRLGKQAEGEFRRGSGNGRRQWGAGTRNKKTGKGFIGMAKWGMAV